MIIDNVGWTQALADGWRLVTNLESADADLVAQHIREYGSKNVCVGIHFDHSKMTPASEIFGWALYVRDTDELIDGLSEDILNLECGHKMPTQI